MKKILVVALTTLSLSLSLNLQSNALEVQNTPSPFDLPYEH
ncbi:hypothetical protein ACUXCC_004291 [Cytobacillus horneckiae]|nr:hypothetical protein [Cytobacillus horneckiae]